MKKFANPALPLPGVTWRGFTLRVFLAVILPLAILLMAIVIISQSLHHQAMTILVGERNQSAVQSAAHALETALEHQAESLQLAADALQSGATLQQPSALLTRLLSDFSGGLTLADSTGAVLQSSAGAAPDLRAGQAAFWQTLKTAPVGEARFSPTLSAAQDDFLVWVGLPLDDGSCLLGAFSARTLIAPALANALTHPESRVEVAGPQGQVLYAQGSADPNPADTSAGLQAALTGSSGVLYPQTHHGDRIIAYHPIQPAGWGLVLAETWQDSASPSLSITQLAPLLLVPMLALSLVGLWYGARKVIYPLQQLEGQAARLAQGDFDAVDEPVDGIEEIERVQSELARMAADLQAAQAALHAYIGSLTSGVEAERLNLARELHDDTLQALIALNQRIQLTQRVTTAPSEREALLKLEDMTRETIANLRRLVRGLRPIYLEDLGLSAALEMLARETAANHPDLEVAYALEGAAVRIENSAELAFYRIAQEALSNALRHAQANHLGVTLHFEPGQVSLRVTDDGLGFELPARRERFVQEGHYGLLGMQERAELIGADFKLESQPGQGTRVWVTKRLGGDETPAI